MGAKLIICEKPSVASDVSKALSSGRTFQKTDWGFKSTDYYVAAAAGHLVQALPPEKYDERYKDWSYEDLPILPERFMYQPRDQRASQRLKTLSDLINSNEVSEIINACDAGREGELIFKLILQYSRNKGSKPVSRAWFSSMTSKAIQDAFASLKPDIEMLPLELSARSREEADWLVGMNATRAATCTLGKRTSTDGKEFRQLLSLGRVQTPTLAILVSRDLEIENFVSTKFYQVVTTFKAESGDYEGLWRAGRDSGDADRFDTLEKAKTLMNSVKKSGAGLVQEVEVRIEEVSPPKLFDLTDLQREANKRYGMTATRTLAAAQSCYESHKVLSYPRTDSRFLPSDMSSEVSKIVKRIRAADSAYEQASDLVLANLDPSPIIDDSKVSDHHGLTPTDAAHDLSKLSEDERRIYDLVARRVLAALLQVQKIERTVVWTSVDTEERVEWFRSAARREIEQGWRLAWPEASGKKKTNAKDAPDEEEVEEDSSLPPLVKDERVRVKDCSTREGQTKPPARFSEASILGIMTTAGKLVEDEELADAMKERGLGTPATRAAILETLLDREYIKREGRKLIATDKGRGLILALGDHPLTKPELTGDWEHKLRQLERAKPSDATAIREEFSKAVRDFTSKVCEALSGATAEQLDIGRRKLSACPSPGCDGAVVEGKRGWGCTTYKSKEEQGCGLIIWKEDRGKKLSEKQVLSRIEDIKTGKYQVPEKKERVVFAKCPTPDCIGDILDREKSWGCSSYKSPKELGCGFVIWKSGRDGSAVTPESALDMISRGEGTPLQKRESVAQCPRCTGNLLDRGKFLGCDSWKSPKKKGCGTSVWKTQAGRELDMDELLDQIAQMKDTPPPKASKKKK